MDTKGCLSKYRIDGYWRFKDDALLLVSDMVLAKQFIWETMSLAGYFVVECEAVSSTQVKLLEVMVIKSKEKFQVRPVYKPTNLGTPLDTSSAHLVHVRLPRPKAVLRRTMLLSSSRPGAEATREILRQRFIHYFAPKPTIDIFEAKTNEDRNDQLQIEKRNERENNCGCQLVIIQFGTRQLQRQLTVSPETHGTTSCGRKHLVAYLLL
jgi:hypothetical protein